MLWGHHLESYLPISFPHKYACKQRHTRTLCLNTDTQTHTHTHRPTCVNWNSHPDALKQHHTQTDSHTHTHTHKQTGRYPFWTCSTFSNGKLWQPAVFFYLSWDLQVDNNDSLGCAHIRFLPEERRKTAQRLGNMVPENGNLPDRANPGRTGKMKSWQISVALFIKFDNRYRPPER